VCVCLCVLVSVVGRMKKDRRLGDRRQKTRGRERERPNTWRQKARGREERHRAERLPDN
jgi:hypothetical protein